MEMRQNQKRSHPKNSFSINFNYFFRTFRFHRVINQWNMVSHWTKIKTRNQNKIPTNSIKNDLRTKYFNKPFFFGKYEKRTKYQVDFCAYRMNHRVEKWIYRLILIRERSPDKRVKNISKEKENIRWKTFVSLSKISLNENVEGEKKYVRKESACCSFSFSWNPISWSKNLLLTLGSGPENFSFLIPRIYSFGLIFFRFFSLLVA